MSDRKRKQPLVPKLRFPEFKNAGEWEVKRLGKICEVKSSKRIHEKDWTKKGIPFYRARELVKFRNGENLDDPIFISREKYEEIKEMYAVPKKKDILITGVGTIGVPYIVPNNEPFYFKDGNIIWLSAPSAIPQWVYLCILNPVVMRNVHNEQGSTVQTFTITQAKKLLIPYPSLDEQQKIADCLASLDELIELESQKCEALRIHKKGLMQQLFPQKGEIVPRLRFPEFRDAREWEVKKVSELGVVSTGKTPRTSNPAFWNGEIVWVTPTDISESKNIWDSDRKLTPKGQKAAGFLPEDSVLVTCIASIGKNAILKVAGACNQQINAIITNNDHTHEFIYYLIENGKNVLVDRSGRSATAIISKTEFEKVVFLIPRKPEQQKIADCLSSLDELIELQSQKVEALKQHKKGLMQQLFPQEVA